jgi:serine/threonine protein kinase
MNELVEGPFSANNRELVIMKFHKGITFEKYLIQQQPNSTALRTVYASVTAALDRLHSFQIAHRDAHHKNFIIESESSQVSVIDFGSTRQVLCM